MAAAIAGMVALALRGETSLASDPTGVETPAFTLPLLDGDGSLTLSDLRGGVVVLNVWSSWCTECGREAPVLAQGWRRWRDEGVAFVGVVTQDSRRGAREFEARCGGEYPSVFDGDGRTKRRQASVHR